MPWIIGIISNKQIQLNPRMSLWNINDHAAILALLNADHPDLLKQLDALIDRI
jgi:hypothetical protein